MFQLQSWNSEQAQENRPTSCPPSKDPRWTSTTELKYGMCSFTSSCFGSSSCSSPIQLGGRNMLRNWPVLVTPPMGNHEHLTIFLTRVHEILGVRFEVWNLDLRPFFDKFDERLAAREAEKALLHVFNDLVYRNDALEFQNNTLLASTCIKIAKSKYSLEQQIYHHEGQAVHHMQKVMELRKKSESRYD